MEEKTDEVIDIWMYLLQTYCYSDRLKYIKPKDFVMTMNRQVV